LTPLRVAAALLVLWVLSLSAAGAQDPYEEQMWEIAERVACPVCSGQSVKDSNALLARQIRDLIVERLRLGDDPETIIQFLANRYGEGIRMDPPKAGLGLGIWIGPMVFFAVGIGIVAFLLKRRPRGASSTSGPSADDGVEGPPDGDLGKRRNPT
jgi:cytochrome c-type biogenesis protein CcmH/NrfF